MRGRALVLGLALGATGCFVSFGSPLSLERGERPLDWGAAEAAAFASLLNQGVPVRMTGQDVARGTFVHRHAVLHDVRDGRTYTPLAHLAENQPRVQLYNSPLSEAGVMSFEWGYSLDTPDALVM